LTINSFAKENRIADDKEPVVTYKLPITRKNTLTNVAVECRLLDFGLRFGLSVHAEPGENSPLMVEFFQGILISPQEAKYLARWLQQEGRRYEECFGPIPMATPAPTVLKAEEAAAEVPAGIVN
jgi:hypothetical protein